MAILGYDQIMKVSTYAELPATATVLQLARTLDSKITYEFDGTVWMPVGRQNVKSSTVVVDGKSIGNTLVYTLEPSGTLNFYPTQVVLRPVSISGAALKPTISVGTNSTAYDNIASGSLLNTITGLLSITTQPLTVSTSPALSGGTGVYAKISTGALATSYTFNVDILGYYK
jgi:hypothetical protein